MAITTIWSDRRPVTAAHDEIRDRVDEAGRNDGGPITDALWAGFLAREPGPLTEEPARKAKVGNTRGRKRKPGLYQDRAIPRP